MGPFWQGGRFDRTPLSVASRVNISLSLALVFCPDAHDSVTTWGRARSCLNKHGNILSFEWHFLFSYLRTVDCAFPLKKYQLRNYTHTQPFNGRWSGTTRVGRYQEKHSPTHTHPGHQTSFISFLHLLRSMASSVFSLRA